MAYHNWKLQAVLVHLDEIPLLGKVDILVVGEVRPVLQRQLLLGKLDFAPY